MENSKNNDQKNLAGCGIPDCSPLGFPGLPNDSVTLRIPAWVPAFREASAGHDRRCDSRAYPPEDE